MHIFFPTTTLLSPQTHSQRDSDAVPLLILIAILRHAGGRAEEKLWGLQFVIGPVNPQTTEVGSMRAKLSSRQFVHALGGVEREFAF